MLAEQWRVENCLSDCHRLLAQICDWYCKERNTERLRVFHAALSLMRAFAEFPLYDLSAHEKIGMLLFILLCFVIIGTCVSWTFFSVLLMDYNSILFTIVIVRITFHCVQHLIWFLGHQEVYIIMSPGFDVIRESVFIFWLVRKGWLFVPIIC